MTLGSGRQNQSSRLAVGTAATAYNSQNNNHDNSGQNTSCWVLHRLLQLPDDVIYVILSYCDIQSLGRLSQVCRRLAYLANQDCVWLAHRNRLTAVRTKEDKRKTRRSGAKLSVKEHCRYATNWMHGHFHDVRLIYHGVKQLPWLQVDNHKLWVSYKNQIRCYKQQTNGFLNDLPMKVLRGHRDDVGRFVIRDNMVVSGSRDRSIHAYSTISGECLVQLPDCHRGDIQAVDCYQEIAVSGSRDATIKIWSLQELRTSEAHRRTLEVHDRVWSIAMNPNGRSFASGTAGINHVAPLRIWDTESGQLLSVLGNQYRYGAGVLDIQYETPDILLSCGYDTYARMWDLRKSHSHCVMKWEEPFDSTLYCVQSDGHNAIITGTARHGLVRLWDKRQNRPVQMYYVGRGSSPVYSLAYDSGHLYVALDKGINMLDFTVRHEHQQSN